MFFPFELIPQLELTPFHNYCTHELRGQPSSDVTTLVTLFLLHLFCGGLLQLEIAAACERNLGFQTIVGNNPPNFRKISKIRKINLAALRQLFLEVLGAARESRMVKLGNLSTDGTRIGAKCLAAQGDELRLHEERNRAAGSRD